jgi:flagellar biosynthetic protein FliR
MDESQIPITSNVFYVFSTLIFLQLNLHHELISALVVSFERIELGSFFKAAESIELLLNIVQQSFVIGLQIAAPFVISVLIANIILGLLSKAMPGMNVFILGMPFKIFFGLLLFIILVPYLYEIFSNILDYGFYYIKEFLNFY